MHFRLGLFWERGWVLLSCVTAISVFSLGEKIKPHDITCQPSMSFTITWSLLKPMSIESVVTSSYLVLCHPLLLPSIFPSIRVFSNELALCVRWPKYRSFSISPSNEYLGLISFSINGFDLFAVQANVFPSTIQNHQFFGTQPSLWSNSHICIWLLENHSFDCAGLHWQSDVSAF